MSIFKDLVSSQTLTLDASGHTTERTYLVDGVGGTSESKLYNAMTTAGIPQYGDPHPILPDVIVTKVTAKPQTSGKQIVVSVSYSVPTPAETTTSSTTTTSASKTTVSTSLANQQTSLDINGNFMTVVWQGIISVTRYVKADVQRPQIQVSFTRTEPSIPKVAIANYLGRINSVPWSGFPAKTWLCTQLNVSEDKTGVFNIDYGFSYNPDTWLLEATVNLTQEQIDELPPDIASSNGYKLFDVYKTADFNSLGLSF